MTVVNGTFAYLDTLADQLTPGEDIFELTHGSVIVTPCKVNYTDHTQIASLEALLRENSIIR
jgi:hypothetical protein